jgi:hypothetical protein
MGQAPINGQIFRGCMARKGLVKAGALEHPPSLKNAANPP